MSRGCARGRIRQVKTAEGARQRVGIEQFEEVIWIGDARGEPLVDLERAWISGAQPEFIVIDVLPQATMIGVHFKPGGLAPFVAMPADELSGALVELDSLAVTELIFALEDEFKVTAKTNGQGMQTLGDIAAYIDQLIAERDAPAARTGS